MSRREKEWAGRLSAWFDGECSELDAAEVQRHLLEDSEARAKLQEWRGLRDDLELLQPEPAGAVTLERMRVRFEDAIAHEVFSMSRQLRWWNIAAAALLLFGLGLVAVDRLAPPAQDTWASQPSAVDEAIHELLTRPPAAPERR